MRVLTFVIVSALSVAACRRPVGDRIPPRTVCQSRAPGVGPTDVVNVVVFNEPQLSGEYRVGEDGAIDYPYLHRVVIAGMQTGEVAAMLRSALGEQTADNPTGRSVLTNPNVRVEIKEANSRRISVSGQVQHPNQSAFTRCLTVTLAVALALVVGTGFLATRMGGEFLPKLGEQALAVSTVRLAGVASPVVPAAIFVTYFAAQGLISDGWARDQQAREIGVEAQRAR